MSSTPLPAPALSRSPAGSSLLAVAADYLELTKPKILLMVLVAVAAAMFVARWAAPDPWLLVHALLGTTLVAASASACNQWLERTSDAAMDRTATRPLPAGRLGESEAVAFAALTLAAGVPYLAIAVNALAAGLALLTWLIYVVLYTPLKRTSTLNTPLGAIAGALPVLIGWAAAGGELGWRAGALFAVLFLWQFPHFMAIAWLCREQYSAAGLKMLTVVDPTGRRAGAQAVVTALALLLVSLVPAFQSYSLSPAGAAAYLVAAFALGSLQLACAVWFCLAPGDLSARWLLRASLVYLPALLAMLVLVPWIGSWTAPWPLVAAP
jgi:protoheme IX farnesyltransferase